MTSSIRLAAVRNIITEGAVAIRERLIQRSNVACRVIFAADTVAVAFPDKAVRTHAPAVILLFVANTVSFLIERVVLFLGDRHLLAGAANVDEIGLLIVIVFLVFFIMKPPSFEWFPNRRPS
jgi:hypothetical protein